MAKRVLIIEDEATQVLLLKSRLQEHGFEVSTAMSGEEGLEKAVAERPDLVLLDIILPRMSGVEVSQRLEELPETKEIPVILVTASRTKDLEERCKTFGADGCLIKPYTVPELLEKISRVLTSAAGERQT